MVRVAGTPATVVATGELVSKEQTGAERVNNVTPTTQQVTELMDVDLARLKQLQKKEKLTEAEAGEVVRIRRRTLNPEAQELAESIVSNYIKQKIEVERSLGGNPLRTRFEQQEARELLQNQLFGRNRGIEGRERTKYSDAQIAERRAERIAVIKAKSSTRLSQEQQNFIEQSIKSAEARGDVAQANRLKQQLSQALSNQPRTSIDRSGRFNQALIQGKEELRIRAIARANNESPRQALINRQILTRRGVGLQYERPDTAELVRRGIIDPANTATELSIARRGGVTDLRTVSELISDNQDTDSFRRAVRAESRERIREKVNRDLEKVFGSGSNVYNTPRRNVDFGIFPEEIKEGDLVDRNEKVLSRNEERRKDNSLVSSNISDSNTTNELNNISSEVYNSETAPFSSSKLLDNTTSAVLTGIEKDAQKLEETGLIRSVTIEKDSQGLDLPSLTVAIPRRLTFGDFNPITRERRDITFEERSMFGKISESIVGSPILLTNYLVTGLASAFETIEENVRENERGIPIVDVTPSSETIMSGVGVASLALPITSLRSGSTLTREFELSKATGERVTNLKTGEVADVGNVQTKAVAGKKNINVEADLARKTTPIDENVGQIRTEISGKAQLIDKKGQVIKEIPIDAQGAGITTPEGYIEFLQSQAKGAQPELSIIKGYQQEKLGGQRSISGEFEVIGEVLAEGSKAKPNPLRIKNRFEREAAIQKILLGDTKVTFSKLEGKLGEYRILVNEQTGIPESKITIDPRTSKVQKEAIKIHEKTHARDPKIEYEPNRGLRERELTPKEREQFIKDFRELERNKFGEESNILQEEVIELYPENQLSAEFTAKFVEKFPEEIIAPKTKTGKNLQELFTYELETLRDQPRTSVGEAGDLKSIGAAQEQTLLELQEGNVKIQQLETKGFKLEGKALAEAEKRILSTEQARGKPQPGEPKTSGELLQKYKFDQLSLIDEIQVLERKAVTDLIGEPIKPGTTTPIITNKETPGKITTETLKETTQPTPQPTTPTPTTTNKQLKVNVKPLAPPNTQPFTESNALTKRIGIETTDLNKKSKIQPNPKLSVDVETNNELIQDTRIIQRNINERKFKERNIIENAFKREQQPITEQEVINRQDTAQRQRVRLETLQTQEQEFKRPTPQNFFTPRIPEPPTPRIPKPVPFPFPDNTRSEEIVDVYVNKKGEPVQIGDDIPLTQAKSLLLQELNTTSSASGYLTDQEGNPITYNELEIEDDDYTKSKRNNFLVVEKRNKRINTPGELREITLKGIDKNKGSRREPRIRFPRGL